MAPWPKTLTMKGALITLPYSSPRGSSPPWTRARNARTPDVFLCTVSPPDDNGYCSFGANLWNKHTFTKLSRTVLAEVDERFIRTYGDNYVHVSEIDAFVENTPPPMDDEELKGILSGIGDEERRNELAEVASQLEYDRRRDFIPQLADLELSQMRQWAAFYAGLSDPGPSGKANRGIRIRASARWSDYPDRSGNALDTAPDPRYLRRQARSRYPLGDGRSGND